MKEIEIPFGAFDSELGGFEYTIPEGYEATIKDGKVIVKRKESEDERTRKELINFIYDAGNLLGEETEHRFIAWLESLKEQTGKKWIYEDDYKSQLDAQYQQGLEDGRKEQEFTHHEVGESLEEAVTHQMEDDGDIDDFVRKGLDDVVLKYAKLGAEWQKDKVVKFDHDRGQKPAEWSEEDDAIHTRVLGALGKAFMGVLPTKPSQEDIEWFKSLPERFNLQPKQEWSEEDELMLEATIQSLKLTNGAAQMKIDWLKSLRPHWKPSKEQMEVMEYYMHSLICNKNKEILFGLYNDLKKL